ncbi:MAG: tyrosine-type recombinase/integrase [Stigonema ocellatum SAG 48.90 = DSM 106950]|nr:tyrosine-type recombinase/integrase [Stigonema ocellatum SAG 48.90 = DSM 106950]
MPKNKRSGQACILTDKDYSNLRKHIQSPKYKLLLDIAWFTGERWGALVKLKVEDVYNQATPREYITFRAQTRKASPNGERKTRQVPVHSTLLASLTAYKPDADCQWLFPNRDGSGPMTTRWADKILRSAVERAGMDAMGISTHSTRRSFITKLHRQGTDIYTIKAITGHQDLKALGRYVEIDTDRIKGAIAAL